MLAPCGLDFPHRRSPAGSRLGDGREECSPTALLRGKQVQGYGFVCPPTSIDGPLVGGSSHHFGMACYRGTTEDSTKGTCCATFAGLSGMLIFTAPPRYAEQERFSPRACPRDYIRIDSDVSRTVLRGSPATTSSNRTRRTCRFGRRCAAETDALEPCQILQAYRGASLTSTSRCPTIHSTAATSLWARRRLESRSFGDVRPMLRTHHASTALDAMASLTVRAAPLLPLRTSRPQQRVAGRITRFQNPAQLHGFDSRASCAAATYRSVAQ